MTTLDPLKIIQRNWYDIPVPVERIIAQMRLIFSRKELPDDISGWIERKNGTYEIVVNAIHPLSRQRFTAAHELGHFIYHRDLLGEGVGDNRAYRAASTTLPNPAITPSHERQANSFAANLLMPRHALSNVTAADSTADLANRFGVSEEAMRIRLGR
jgi:Zn-dependent peptidase ImmA (M78 family)